MTIRSKLFDGAGCVLPDGVRLPALALTSHGETGHRQGVLPSNPTDEWVNEGGADLDPKDGATSEEIPSALPRSSRRATVDTAEWCRERAVADLVAAGEMDTANGRLRFEHSAVSWTARADLLQRLKDSSEAKRIASTEVWPEGATPPAPHRTIREPTEHRNVWQ